MYSKTEQPQAVQRLRDAGLRATGARVAILAALESDRRHPTAEMLFESLRAHLPSLSMSTVYATLESLLQRGLARRIDVCASTALRRITIMRCVETAELCSMSTRTGSSVRQHRGNSRTGCRSQIYISSTRWSVHRVRTKMGSK